MGQSINQLAKVSSLSAQDLVPLFSASLGGDAAATLTTLLEWLQSQITSGGSMLEQFAAPNISGYAITINPATSGANVWLINTPAGSYANLTINLPIGVDGQEVLVTTTQAVTGALTVIGATVGAGAQPVNGAPATLTANGFFRLKFCGVTSSWYRIG